MTQIRKIGTGLDTIDKISRALYQISNDLSKTLTKGVSVTDNLDAIAFTVADSGTADTAIQVNHGLGRSPEGYIITNQDKAGSVYTSGSDIGTISGAVLFTDASNMAFSGYFF